GVGKKTIIQKIARLIVEDNVPNALKNKRILQINIPLLLEKATPQEIQEKLLVIFDEAEKSGNIILYFENLENLTNLYINTDANLAINEIIFNYFSSRDNYSFASTTSDNFKTHLENKLICNALNVININEPKENLAIQILASKVSSLEKKHQVFFSYNWITA
ncbi:MAG: hypothetical protein NT091_02365, partial [Candidatus Falkowbacteria bacterium]|nr:hypothetical protein [Candidatus Falkowbacteria bacterium]